MVQPKGNSMLSDYIHAAMLRATFKTLEDNSIFGEIPGIQGVWSNAPSRAEAERELQEVLEDWLMLSLEDHTEIPDIDGISLQHTRVS